MSKAVATALFVLALLAAISRATGNDPVHDAANRLAATYAAQTAVAREPSGR